MKIALVAGCVQRGVPVVRIFHTSGIRTEQCCETTTQCASDLGWNVDFVTEATLTFDMVQPDGTTLAAADIVTRTANQVLHSQDQPERF